MSTVTYHLQITQFKGAAHTVNLQEDATLEEAKYVLFSALHGHEAPTIPVGTTARLYSCTHYSLQLATNLPTWQEITLTERDIQFYKGVSADEPS